MCNAEIPLSFCVVSMATCSSNKHLSVCHISISARVLMGLSLIPRLSGERSSGAMHEWLEGLVGFEPLLDEEATCGCRW